MHVSKGIRTYNKNDDSFGDVTRTRMFGKESSAVVVKMDDGSFKAFIGKDAIKNVINTDTSKDIDGVDVEVPTDVKMVGPALLSELGVDAANQSALFQKFMVMSKENRRSKIKEWKESKDDPVKNSKFMTEILELLDDDTQFIQTHAAKLLKQFDSEKKAEMMIKLNSITTHEQRKQLIIDYTSIKTDKIKTEVFMQELYELLLDDNEYLYMQMKKFGIRYYKEDELVKRIEKFFEVRSEKYVSLIISRWRQRKLYNHRNGAGFIRNQLRRLKI